MRARQSGPEAGDDRLSAILRCFGKAHTNEGKISQMPDAAELLTAVLKLKLVFT